MNRKKAGIRVPLPAFRDRAFTLLELIVAMPLLLLLTRVALPIARDQVKRAKEVELRRDLREMRQAIDRYKDFADRGMIAANQNTFGYPPYLMTSADVVARYGTATPKHHRF